METKSQQWQRTAESGENSGWLHSGGSGAGALPVLPNRNSRVALPRKDERIGMLKERLATLEREHNELLQAIFTAAQTHRKLCAPREARRGKFEIAAEIFPVRHLSGDFSLLLDCGATTGLAVGDIAGKGLTAGLWLPHLVGLVRTGLGSGLDPSEAAALINAELWKMQPEPPMAALFLARLDPHHGELIYCNAGQPAAVVLRADGRLEFLEAGGPLLGAVSEASFASGRAVLDPGDALLSFSDGIVECRNDRGEEFGVGRLVAASRAAGRSSTTSMLFSLLGAAQDFAGGRPPEDDLTLMIARRLG